MFSSTHDIVMRYVVAFLFVILAIVGGMPGITLGLSYLYIGSEVLF